MCLHEEKASFRYPWNIHMYLIFPLAAITLFTAFAFGWQGEGPYHVFTEFRAAYPFLSRVFHSITDWGNPLLYCIYVMLLIRAIRTGDIKIIWNIVCVLILSLLFLGIFLQLLKYGLGMPRPGIPWPPRPWSSASYTSFPSGHTANILVSVIPLGIWIRDLRFRTLLSLLAACMGISRIWLGVHHPVDIAGSIVFGSVAAWCIVCFASSGFGRIHMKTIKEKA